MANIQKYLDRSVAVLEKFGIVPKESEESQLATILQEVVTVDEPRVLAIAKTVRYASSFNDLVRNNVADMHVTDRYADISQMFNSIRDDSKRMLEQLSDGKVDFKERMQNMWMRVVRGTTHQRFDKIKGLYLDVSRDTKQQLTKEAEIMDAYLDFRFAMKDAEILANEVLKTEDARLEQVDGEFKTSAERLDKYSGNDNAEKSRLQMSRDQAQHAFEVENRNYQLIKDVAELLSMGYNVGETLVAKLKQTHDVKDQVHRKAIAFFGTNEHVFTTMDAVYTSQQGLHEATQTLESMKEGVNKGLEDIATLGRNLEKAAIKAGYGSVYNPESVRKFVDAIVSYQEESQQMIGEARAQATKDVAEITTIVEAGKARCRDALLKYKPAA